MLYNLILSSLKCRILPANLIGLNLNLSGISFEQSAIFPALQGDCKISNLDPINFILT